MIQRVVGHVQKRSSRFMGSQLLEDGFNYQKSKAITNANKMFSDDARFNALLLGHVIDEKHKFKPVNVDACVVPRACGVAENVSRQAPEDAWVVAKSVMGTKPSPAGYSPSANELN